MRVVWISLLTAMMSTSSQIAGAQNTPPLYQYAAADSMYSGMEGSGGPLYRQVGMNDATCRQEPSCNEEMSPPPIPFGEMYQDSMECPVVSPPLDFPYEPQRYLAPLVAPMPQQLPMAQMPFYQPQPQQLQLQNQNIVPGQAPMLVKTIALQQRVVVPRTKTHMITNSVAVEDLKIQPTEASKENAVKAPEGPKGEEKKPITETIKYDAEKALEALSGGIIRITETVRELKPDITESAISIALMALRTATGAACVAGAPVTVTLSPGANNGSVNGAIANPSSQAGATNAAGPAGIITVTLSPPMACASLILATDSSTMTSTINSLSTITAQGSMDDAKIVDLGSLKIALKEIFQDRPSTGDSKSFNFLLSGSSSLSSGSLDVMANGDLKKDLAVHLFKIIYWELEYRKSPSPSLKSNYDFEKQALIFFLQSNSAALPQLTRRSLDWLLGSWDGFRWIADALYKNSTGPAGIASIDPSVVTKLTPDQATKLELYHKHFHSIPVPGSSCS